MTISDTIAIRVRYNETDGQGRVHHAQYLNYFERGRVELMRSLGHSYREFEEDGLMLVVSAMNVKYLGAAQFDDLLELTTRVVRSRGVRIEHAYEISRSEPGGPSGPTLEEASDDAPRRQAGETNGTPQQTIVTATSTIACVDRQGKVRRLPDFLRQA